MNFIYKLIAIIYRTYDDRGHDIPHFKAIVTVLFLFFVNIVCVGLLFDIPSEYIMPWISQEGKTMQSIKATIYFIVPIVLFSIIFNKKILDKIPVTERQIYRGRRILPIYILASTILLVVLLVRHGVQKGAINL